MLFLINSLFKSAYKTNVNEFKELLKLSRKNSTNTNSKMFKDTFFSKGNTVSLDDTEAGGFFDDLNSEGNRMRM